MVSATLQINSNLVSGLAKLVWQTVPTFLLYKLAELLISAHNLHTIYDRRTTLKPRNSILFTLTNTPVGHPPVVLLLSLLLLFHIFLSVALDFSIGGETKRIYEPVVYPTVIGDHPDATPLLIDYAAEYKPPSGEDKAKVSRRLLAAAEISACLYLNGTHHQTFAHAYRGLRLDNKLVNIDDNPPLGECVRRNSFETDRISTQYLRTGFQKASCDIEKLTISYDSPPSGIGVATPQVASKGLLRFDPIRCFRGPSGADTCGGIALHKTVPVIYSFSIQDASDPGKCELHELRFPRMPTDALRARYAANVAFAKAIGLNGLSGSNAMFFAIARIQQDVTLRHFVRERDVTVLNIAVLGTVAALEGLLLVALCAAAGILWTAWVANKGRREYIAFSNLLDVFAMVGREGFVKKHEKGRMTRVVALVGDEPAVFVDQDHVKVGGGGGVKRLSDDSV